MPNEDLIDRLRIAPNAGAAPERRPFWPWLVAIGLLAVLLGALWSWLARAGALEVETVAVTRVEVDPGASRASVLDASGYVVARRQATVAAEVTGKLIEVNVEEGLRVEAGQVLARIDDASEQAQLKLAEARRAAAESALAEIRAQLEDARRTLKRQRELLGRDLTSQADVDAAATAVETLEARLQSQREQIAVAAREVDVWRQRIEELTIRAPFSGVVIARAAQAGEMVSPVSAGGGFTRTGICTIVDMDSLEIEVDVNEAYIDRVQPGQPVEARLDAYPDWAIPARVKAVVPAADRQKATVRVRVEFVELDPRILPEMGISVRFLSDAPEAEAADARTPVAAVPEHAIVRVDGRDYVFVVADGRVERRAVRLGAPVGNGTGNGSGKRVAVIAGLAGGETLVARADALALEDGARVRVAD